MGEKSLYDFAQVEANTAKPASVDVHIKTILRGEVVVDPETEEITVIREAAYPAVEAVLLPPGKNGSRAFDQKEAVDIILVHDVKYGGSITRMMKETPRLTHRYLWDRLVFVLRDAGFKMQHGRLAGLLEHKPSKSTDDDKGNPDID